LLGYAVLFFVEAATVFLNDWFDYESDRINDNAGIFNGGSRVLVDGRITHRAMRIGIGMSIAAAFAALTLLMTAVPGPAQHAIVSFYLLFTLLAFGYTVPPLKLSHRGLGELDVAITHSAAAILAGYMAARSPMTFRGSSPFRLRLPFCRRSFLPTVLIAAQTRKSANARSRSSSGLPEQQALPQQPALLRHWRPAY
jgi:4-hydroxybenzoate polyprenyltransferase